MCDACVDLGPGLSVGVQVCVSYKCKGGEGTQPLSPRVVEDGEEAGEVEVEGKIEVALRLEL